MKLVNIPIILLVINDYLNELEALIKILQINNNDSIMVDYVNYSNANYNENFASLAKFFVRGIILIIGLCLLDGFANW